MPDLVAQERFWRSHCPTMPVKNGENDGKMMAGGQNIRRQ
jgi:hypothetical protein